MLGHELLELQQVTFGANQKGLNALRELFAETEIQSLNRDGIRQCQMLLGHGEEFGLWQTPVELVGRRLKSNHANFVLRNRILRCCGGSACTLQVPDNLIDQGVAWVTKYAILLRTGPSALQKKLGRSLDPTTIIIILKGCISVMIGRAIQRRIDKNIPPDAEGFLKYLTPDDVRSFNSQGRFRTELKRIEVFAARGLWSDVPYFVEDPRITDPSGEALPDKEEECSNPFLPLPDEYLSEIGPRIRWIVTDLGPNVIMLARALPEMIHNVSLRGPTFPKRLLKYFASAEWRDRDGKLIQKPPFSFRIGSRQGAHIKHFIDENEWPPRTWQQVQAVLVTLQAAHLWIVLLASGGRLQEVVTLSRDCIDRGRSGVTFINGKTFKFSPFFNGEARQWPAPQLVVEALTQQAELIDACELIAWTRSNSAADNHRVHGSHLWGSFGTGGRTQHGEPLVEVNHALSLLAKRLDMLQKPGGRNLHAHRFRKTIARLAALAIVDSPRVLMQLFGHSDITLTLHYILADKALQVEIDQVARELRIMRCEEIIESIHSALHEQSTPRSGGHGGGAVTQIVETIGLYENDLERSGRGWGAETAYDLAVVLTMNGQYFRYIKPGVICIKPSNELSPCQCDSTCLNRIEHETARRDVAALIPTLIEEGQRALACSQLMVLANIVSQLDEELSRFKDIQTQWADDETLR